MYDLIVIGGGPGGYSSAIRASQYGLKVALVEKVKLGGTCINVGCIPTKVYAHTTSIINEMNNFEDFGISVEYNIDLNKLRNKKNTVIKNLEAGIKYLMNKNGVDVIKGQAEFLDNSNIIVDGKKYNGKNFIIATGSETVVPPIEGIKSKGVFTSDKALEIETIPKKLVIIGAGIIGLEFANIYSTLGSDVTVVEMLPTLLPMLDIDVSSIFADILENKNIKLMLNKRVEKIQEITEGLEVTVSEGVSNKIINCDAVLVAVGRKANINGVSALDLNIEKKGIEVNSKMQTNIENIYCIGDVNGISQLAHIATYQADIAVKNIIGDYCNADYKSVPGCIYTEPEISFVGLNEEEARKKYNNIKTGVFPFSYSGRAQTMNSLEGMIKVICEGDYDQIVGVQIIGKNASEIIHEGVLAIKYDLSVHELIDVIHAHPTLSESFKEVCEDVLGTSVNKG